VDGLSRLDENPLFSVSKNVEISVIIPVRNEAAELPETVRRLRAVPEVVELIVVDGGSSDGTFSVADDLGCRVVESAPGRGIQMRRGAELATGDVVWFVHADTWVDGTAGAAIREALSDSEIVGGGFWKVFRESHWMLRGSRFKCWIRFVLFGWIFGDQTFFVRRGALEKTGGVPAIVLMEDVELCRALRRLGKLVLAKGIVTTSARRFIQRGIFRTYGRMLLVLLGYAAGRRPEQLRGVYESNRAE
jgi:rSAM/selenodomain-associated transferase 2